MPESANNPATLPAIEHAGPPAIEAVRFRAAAEMPGWNRRLPAGRPRLFFDADQWAGLRGRYAESSGRRRQLFDAALAKAAAIVARPTVSYRSPAEVSAADRLTAFDASQELWQRPVGNGMVALALALALTGDPATRAKLRDVVLSACAYPQWGLGHNQRNGDLAAGHVARGIAVALDWHRDLMDDCERASVLAALRPRANALVSAACGGNYWAGHYDENHNNVCVCAIGLCGLAFLGELPDAAEWTALGLINFDRVAAECSPDGTSPEGVPYWSYGLSFTLQYIEGTRHVLGTDRLYAAPYFRRSIAGRLHASTPDLSGTIPWGDAVPRDYYGPQHLLYRLAAEYRDGTGQFLADRLPYTSSEPDDAVWAALWYDPTLAAAPPIERDSHAEVAGVICSRSGWDANDYLLCFKAGYTNRNHSHLDAGAIAWCAGSDWLLRTPGYGRGKGEPSFWDGRAGRWTYFSNSTQSHCTLLIDGRNQRIDADARGTIDNYQPSADWLWTGADLTEAYAGAARVRRDILHRRGAYVLVFDTVDAPEAGPPLKIEWLAQVPPDAAAAPAALHTRGEVGRLTVLPVWPVGGQFALRPPTSEHIDVEPAHLRTFALSQTGRRLRFVTALLPSRSRDAAPDAAISADGETVIRIATAGWIDRIVLQPRSDRPPAVTVTRAAGGTESIFNSQP